MRLRAIVLLAFAASVGPTAAPEAVCKALQGPHSGVMTTWDFSAPDMTGITLSGYIFSKLVNGVYTRLPTRLND